VTIRHDRATTIRLDRKSLGDGSERRDAYLTRTGIFVYHFDPEDGLGFREIRELRPAEEVFADDSLETLRAVTVVQGHPANIDSENWKTHAVGHVGDDVRKSDDGKFVAGSLVIKDRSTLEALDRGELGELSCGYQVELEWSPGEYEGERYDAVQRSIRYNHVGIGDAQGWGRAGHEVRIRDAYSEDMSIKLDTATRIDAPAGAPNANTDADNLRKDLEVVRGERDSARGEVKKEKERADKAEGERDSLKTKLDAASANSDQATIDARVAARIELQDSARSVLGKDFVFQGKSDREIRVAVITKHDPKFDATEKTDAYLEGAYLYASKTVQDEQQALSNVNETAVSDTTNADGKSSVVEDEKKKMAERNANAWRPKPKA
jgi:hypothetical protein